MGILGDFLSPEAGQKRRQWLDGVDEAASEGLRYFLGPSGVDTKINNLAKIAGMLSDGTDYMDATAAGGKLMKSGTVGEAIANFGEFAAPAAAVMIPGVSNRLVQGAADVAGDAARFVADESGAMRLFHGSPHDFDKFSMDKIGTGEGAQAYGHGLYFAEKEDVAHNYRNNLSGQAQGTPYVADEVRGWVESTGGDYAKAAQDARAFLKENGDQMDREQVAELKNAIYLMDRGKESFGRMYEVNVNANPEDFLDWDAPLSAQPPKVRGMGDVLAQTDDVFSAWTGNGTPITGQMLYNRWGGGDGRKMDAALRGSTTQDMAAQGIPGIKYLDQGSRGAGDGSRNYVVFDENLISIIRKYGIAGAATMLGMSQADLAQAAGLDGQTGQPMAATPPRADQ